MTGGTRVTITGSGFTGTSVVGFGGMPGTDLSVASDTTLTVTNPLGPPARFAYTAVLVPTCAGVSASVPAGATATLQLSCIGDQIVYDQPTDPTHGTLSGLDPAAGTVDYTPNPRFTGTVTYTAHNSGGKAAPAAVTITVTPVAPGPHAQALTFPAPAAVRYGESSQSLTATATSGLAVSYTAAPEAVCAVDGARLSAVAAGTCTVTATQAGDDSFTAAEPAIRTIIIDRALLTVTASDAAMDAGEPLPAVHPIYTGFVGNDAAEELDIPPTCTADPASKITECRGGADTNYTFNYVRGTLTVRPSAGTGPQPTASLSDSAVTAGSTVTITGTGFEPAETVEATLHSAPSNSASSPPRTAASVSPSPSRPARHPDSITSR